MCLLSIAIVVAHFVFPCGRISPENWTGKIQFLVHVPLKVDPPPRVTTIFKLGPDTAAAQASGIISYGIIPYDMFLVHPVLMIASQSLLFFFRQGLLSRPGGATSWRNRPALAKLGEGECSSVWILRLRSGSLKLDVENS